MSFSDSLQQGQLGESIIAQWLRSRGWHVLPAYEKEIDNGKGPRLFLAQGNRMSQLIVPDILGIRNGDFKWFEVKHKTRFTWYGKGKYFVTGIDKRHFDDYCQVASVTDLPVWVLFLHVNSDTWKPDVEKWNDPAQCPTGLFGAEITKMRKQMSHFSDRHGTTGMYYWQPFVNLHLLATLNDVLQVTRLAA